MSDHIPGQRRYRNVPVDMGDGMVGFMQEAIPEPEWDDRRPSRHYWHNHTETPRSVDETAILDAMNVWNQEEGKAQRAARTGKVRRSWNVGWRRTAKRVAWLLVAAVVVGALLAASGAVSLACLARCPMP